MGKLKEKYIPAKQKLIDNSICDSVRIKYVPKKTDELTEADIPTNIKSNFPPKKQLRAHHVRLENVFSEEKNILVWIFRRFGDFESGKPLTRRRGTFRPKQFIEILSNSINIWNCFQDILPSQLIDSYNLLSPIQNSYLILNLYLQNLIIIKNSINKEP